MQGVTLAVAITASVLIIALPVRHALVAYFAALCWYPSYLSAPIGTVDFTVGRIVILVLAARVAASPGALARFRWNWIDRLVVVAMAAEILAGIMTTPASELMENRAGAAFDTVLPYFAVRLALAGWREYRALLVGLLIVAAPLAVFGAYQCMTGDNPFGFLREYAFTMPTAGDEPLRFRHGFWRAEVTFAMPIMFGLFFAMMGPVAAGLWTQVRGKAVLAAGLLLMAVGAMSSLSSGPWLAAMTAGAIMAFYPFRRYWKTALAGVVLLFAVIEIASNRHWYEVLASYATLNAETAYYRIELMREAFTGGMEGHWLLGYGSGAGEMPGWQHGDITNHYILILLRYGLVGLCPFLLLITSVFAALHRAFTKAVTGADRWAVWCITAAVAGTAVTMFSVSLFAQPTTLLYVLFALASAPFAAGKIAVRVIRRRPPLDPGTADDAENTGERPR